MTLYVPTATWVGVTADNTPDFDILLGEPGDVIAGAILHSEYTSNGGASWTDYFDRTVTVSDLVDLAISVASGSLNGGTFQFRFRIESATENGDWSNEVTVTLSTADLTGGGAGALPYAFFGRSNKRKILDRDRERFMITLNENLRPRLGENR